MMENEVIETTAVDKSVEQAASKTVAEIKQSGIGDIWTNKETFNQALRAADMLSKSQLVPQQYQGKPQDCFIALEMASRTGIPPLVILQNMYVVKGKPAWSGQTCLSLINSCGRFKNAHTVYFGKEGEETRGCYITATRLCDGEQVDGIKVTLKMAAAEGWTSNSKWRNMPDLMLAYRAAAFFARTNCPEALQGMKVEGEWEDIETNNQPTRSKTDDMIDAAMNAEKGKK